MLRYCIIFEHSLRHWDLFLNSTGKSTHFSGGEVSIYSRLYLIATHLKQAFTIKWELWWLYVLCGAWRTWSPLPLLQIYFWNGHKCNIVVISGPTNAIKRKRLLIFQMFLSLSILFFSITACFCCQRSLCFARQSVLCQFGLLCVMQEGRNLGAPCVLLRSDQCRLPQTSAVCCGDSPALCFDVWSQLQFPVLHHSHKNVSSKTKPWDESRPLYPLRIQTRRQNPNITGFSNRSAGKISLLSENINKVHFSDKTVFWNSQKNGRLWSWRGNGWIRQWSGWAIITYDNVRTASQFTLHLLFMQYLAYCAQSCTRLYAWNNLLTMPLCIGLYN